jgi:hypothetical protein
MHFWQICERLMIVYSPCNSVSFHIFTLIFTRGCFVGFATPDPWKCTSMISPLHMLALDSDVCPTPVTHINTYSSTRF